MVQFLSKIFGQTSRIFQITVLLPTIISSIYFGLVASDVYVSESVFVVRSPEKRQPSSLGFILNSAGLSNSSEESASVLEYVRSRDALAALEKDHFLRKAYATDQVSTFDRFGGILGGTSEEELFSYFGKKVKVEHDSISNVLKLSVQAFTPKDAQEINRRLLERSEALVNQLSARSSSDTIALNAAELQDAELRAREAAVALARFRNQMGIVDPEKQATVQLQMVSKLQDELIMSRTQLSQLLVFTPINPQVPVLKARIADLQREIDAATAKVAGNSSSLASAAVLYEKLQLDSQVADKQLASAIASLEEAKTEAHRKHAYVERIAQPSLPDYANEPRRLRGVMATLALGLVLWGLFTVLVAGVKEHRD